MPREIKRSGISIDQAFKTPNLKGGIPRERVLDSPAQIKSALLRLQDEVDRIPIPDMAILRRISNEMNGILERLERLEARLGGDTIERIIEVADDWGPFFPKYNEDLDVLEIWSREGGAAVEYRQRIARRPGGTT